MTRLVLTTPLAQGPLVVKLQQALVQGGYLTGTVDGQYGVVTAQAVHRAQYWLGYAKPDQDLQRPDVLLSFLAGKPTTAVMKARAKLRNRGKARRTPDTGSLTVGQHVVQVALSQLGETEHPPDSNRSKFSLWYGMVGAWCAMFVTWVFVEAKVGRFHTFVRSRRYSFVPNIVQDAERGENGLSVTHSPDDGVVVCFDWNHDGEADHVGICANQATLERLALSAFREAQAAQGAALRSDEFWTVEGNTAYGNDSNGGVVMIRKRSVSEVRRFCRVAV